MMYIKLIYAICDGIMGCRETSRMDQMGRGMPFCASENVTLGFPVEDTPVFLSERGTSCFTISLKTNVNDINYNHFIIFFASNEAREIINRFVIKYYIHNLIFRTIFFSFETCTNGRKSKMKNYIADLQRFTYQFNKSFKTSNGVPVFVC